MMNEREVESSNRLAHDLEALWKELVGEVEEVGASDDRHPSQTRRVLSRAALQLEFGHCLLLMPSPINSRPSIPVLLAGS